MNDVKLVAAFAENKPGQVAHFTKILANANINIPQTRRLRRQTGGRARH
jgi:hypothetical protein